MEQEEFLPAIRYLLNSIAYDSVYRQFEKGSRPIIIGNQCKRIKHIEKSGSNNFLVENAFNRLRIFIDEYEFKDESEEIIFFKEIKPNLFCYLIYYQKMYNLEIRRPIGGYVELKICFEKELTRIPDFFDKNKVFYRYYGSNEISMDNNRGETDNTLYQNSMYHRCDPKFSIVADLKLTRILANSKLEQYIYIANLPK